MSDGARIAESITPDGTERFWNFWCPGCHDIHSATDRIWTFSGTLERPTIRASLLVNGDGSSEMHHRCHSFVTDGRIEFLGDCTHSMAGQTVDLPEIPGGGVQELVERYWREREGR